MSGEVGAIYNEFATLANELIEISRLMIHVQDADVSKLQKRAIEASNAKGLISPSDSEYRMISRVVTDPVFSGNVIRSSYINYYVMRLSALIDAYLRNSLKDSLIKNSKLLLRATSEAVEGGWNKKRISKKLRSILRDCNEGNYDGSKHNDYLNLLVRRFTQEKFFIGEFETYAKLFGIDFEIIDSGKIQQLIELRNSFAHRLRHDTGNFPYIESVTGEQYYVDSEVSSDMYKTIIDSLITITVGVVSDFKKIEQFRNREWKSEFGNKVVPEETWKERISSGKNTNQNEIVGRYVFEKFLTEWSSKL
jgi:hypothetical protein